MVASIGGITAACSTESPEPDTPSEFEVDLDDPEFAALLTNDSWLLHPEYNVIIGNREGVLGAFSSVCPHSGCTRDWSLSTTIFSCRCHGSTFNSKGDLIEGPATRGLTSLNVVREANKLIVKL